MKNPFLIGPRVYLRAIELSDAERIVAWLNHPDVRRFLARRSPLNLVQEEQFIRELGKKAGERVLLVAAREQDRPLGVIGIHPLDPIARCHELGIAIGEPDAWGQGYGREAIGLLLDHAFAELNLHRVQLRVLADNARAIRCYERVGFQREGVLREAFFDGGRHVDELLLAVLQREWLDRSRDERG